jgi:hypothetical protein
MLTAKAGMSLIITQCGYNPHVCRWRVIWPLDWRAALVNGTSEKQGCLRSNCTLTSDRAKLTIPAMQRNRQQQA